METTFSSVLGKEKEISFLVCAADGNILISLTYPVDMLDFKDTDKIFRARQ